MMNPFKQMGDLNKMRQEAMKIQKELQKEEVTVDEHGVTVTVRGDQHILLIVSNGKSDKDIADAVNKGLKKSQEVAAKKLTQMGGGLGGLLGGM